MIDPQTLSDNDAEQSVIGAALLDLPAADECLTVLRANMFHREAHRRIWTAVGALRGKNAGCDLLTVCDELQRTGDLQAVGGPGYVADLQSAVPSTTNARHYAEIVRDAFVRREIVRAAQEAIAAARDVQQSLADVSATVDAGLRAAADAAVASDQPEELADLVMPAHEYIEAVYERRLEPGIPTGIGILDANIGGGLHRGELAIVGAPPSEGKSAIAQGIAMHMAAHGRRVLYATPEMTKLNVALRALAFRGEIDLRRLTGTPAMNADDWPRLEKALGALAKEGRGLWVEDKATTFEAIAAHARRLQARKPLDLVVIDHLHELEWPKGSDTENRAITEIVRGCKALAKRMDLAVLLLSQLNRAARSEKREPEMHDFRGSGAIEQHADLALLLQRKDDGEFPPRVVPVLVKIAKQRNGATGKLTLLHDRATGHFRDPKAHREGVA